MRNASMYRKIIVSILAMMLLNYGVQDVSYGQVEPTVEAGDDDTKHKHDGFYLRLTTGFGSTASIEEGDGIEISLNGVSGNTTIGIGYAVVENLIINLDFFSSVVVNPTVEVREEFGESREEFGESSVEELTFSNIGIGATYYIMPANVYLTGSIALASGTIDYGKVTYESDAGYGINVAVGKEWWVSDNWGIGVAGQFFRTVLPDAIPIKGQEVDFKTTSIGILFSATFN